MRRAVCTFKFVLRQIFSLLIATEMLCRLPAINFAIRCRSAVGAPFYTPKCQILSAYSFIALSAEKMPAFAMLISDISVNLSLSL